VSPDKNHGQSSSDKVASIEPPKSSIERQSASDALVPKLTMSNPRTLEAPSPDYWPIGIEDDWSRENITEAFTGDAKNAIIDQSSGVTIADGYSHDAESGAETKTKTKDMDTAVNDLWVSTAPGRPNDLDTADEIALPSALAERPGEPIVPTHSNVLATPDDSKASLFGSETATNVRLTSKPRTNAPHTSSQNIARYPKWEEKDVSRKMSRQQWKEYDDMQRFSSKGIMDGCSYATPLLNDALSATIPRYPRAMRGSLSLPMQMPPRQETSTQAMSSEFGDPASLPALIKSVDTGSQQTQEDSLPRMKVHQPISDLALSSGPKPNGSMIGKNPFTVSRKVVILGDTAVGKTSLHK